MKSLSKGEIDVINFLVRNFSEKFTIRSIALKLDMSPAGVHALLKKLEKNSIVVKEKLGTGLFYDLNFKNKVAKHLAAIVLLESEVKDTDVEEIKGKSKSILITNDDALIITDNISTSSFSLEELNAISITEDEFVDKIRAKDKPTLNLIRQGKCVHGEMELVNLIKKGAYQ